jgi:protein SCO1/2
MRKSQKIGLLLLLLAIPIFFVLFFELFSTSHYAVPVYYENGIDSLQECEPSSNVHQINYSEEQNGITPVMGSLSISEKLTVVYPLPSDCDTRCQFLLEELSRLQNIFDPETLLQFLFIADTAASTQNQIVNTFNQNRLGWSLLGGTEADITSFLQCELVLPRAAIPIEETIVLVDEQRQIRGYYQGTSTEEVDRLIAEIKILLYSREVNETNASDSR